MTSSTAGAAFVELSFVAKQNFRHFNKKIARSQMRTGYFRMALIALQLRDYRGLAVVKS